MKLRPSVECVYYYRLIIMQVVCGLLYSMYCIVCCLICYFCAFLLFLCSNYSSHVYIIHCMFLLLFCIFSFLFCLFYISFHLIYIYTYI